MADVDIRLIGGAAVSEIVCGNTAEAVDLANRRGVARQRNDCTSRASGGDVLLENVDILVSAAARKRADNAAALAVLAGDVSTDAKNKPGTAKDKCDNKRPPSPPGTVQRNKCKADARGGTLTLDRVTVVDRRADGSTSTRYIATATVAAASTATAAAKPPPAANGSHGDATAVCANVVREPLNQRDDCVGHGTGAAWRMQSVDVVIHHPDGTTSTRRNITVEVRGGTADATIDCFNVIEEGSGRVHQVNNCDADAEGGSATLRNVTIQTLP